MKQVLRVAKWKRGPQPIRPVYVYSTCKQVWLYKAIQDGARVSTGWWVAGLSSLLCPALLSPPLLPTASPVHSPVLGLPKITLEASGMKLASARGQGQHRRPSIKRHQGATKGCAQGSAHSTCECDGCDKCFWWNPEPARGPIEHGLRGRHTFIKHTSLPGHLRGRFQPIFVVFSTKADAADPLVKHATRHTGSEHLACPARGRPCWVLLGKCTVANGSGARACTADQFGIMPLLVLPSNTHRSASPLGMRGTRFEVSK